METNDKTVWVKAPPADPSSPPPAEVVLGATNRALLEWKERAERAERRLRRLYDILSTNPDVPDAAAPDFNPYDAFRVCCCLHDRLFEIIEDALKPDGDAENAP